MTRAPSRGLFWNAGAGAIGYAWSAALQLACVPVYVGALGTAGYGLVGFYLSLFAMLQVFDLGLTPALNRELARASVDPALGAKTRDLVRTIEVLYVLAGVVLGAAIVLLAPLMAARWLSDPAMPPETIERCVRWMGVSLALQWPVALYHGGLVGLQRQSLSSAVKIAGSTLLLGGTALVVVFVSATPEAFFLAQVAGAAVQLVLLRTVLWRALPAGKGARFQLGALRSLQRFAASLTVISALSLVLMYLDRLVVSALLPLDALGRYTVSWSVANGLLVVTMPVFHALNPRLTALMAAGDTAGVRETYGSTAQLLGATLGTLAAVIGWFAEPVLWIWTGDPALATSAAPVVAVLIFGTALNGMLFMPYALQLASGWIRPVLVSSIVFVIALVPATIFSTARYGALGPAVVWLTLNLASLFTVAPVVHRRVIPRQGWRWLGSWLLPAAVAFACAGALRAAVATPSSRWLGAAVLAAVLAGCGLAALLSTPLGRRRLFGASGPTPDAGGAG